MRLLLNLTMLGVLTATPALPAQKDYNGRWAIYGTTEQGQCKRGFRLNIRISRGKAYVVGRSLGGRKAVSSGGQVNIRYVDGGDVITINGMLKSRTGAGKWHYPTYRCTGQWRAKKLWSAVGRR
jgi:hypothetical protein